MSTVFRVMKNDNYSIISNQHLRDKRLSLKAKGLLTIMLSLPEDWDYTLAGLVILSDDGITATRNTLLELEAKDYLIRKQLKNEFGQFCNIKYYIFENPEDCREYRKNSGKPSGSSDVMFSNNGENTEKIPEKSKEISSEKTDDFFDPADVRFSNNGKSNAINNLCNKEKNSKLEKESISEQENILNKEDLKSLIRENIEYSTFSFSNKDDKAFIDEIIDLITETILSKKEKFKIKGVEIPAEAVKERLFCVDKDNLLYVKQTVEKSRNKIKNLPSYLLSVLYSSTFNTSFAVKR